MGAVRWRVSPWALLAFAVLFYFDSSGLVSAIVPAALAHELGHLLALRLCGRRVRAVRLGLFGMELDYAPQMDSRQALICLMSGPAFGAVYAVAACTLGGAFLTVSGAVSFVLTVFNLLPAMPLDGGRIVAALAPGKTAKNVSKATAFAAVAAGAAICVRYRAAAPLLPGLWLLSVNTAPRLK